MGKPTRPPVKSPPPTPTEKALGRPQIQQARKAPAAPPVYRPQPAPKALQRKAAAPPHMGANQRLPVAPPVYRPQPVPKVLQRKGAGAPQRPPQVRPNPPPVAPPASRPPTLRKVSGPPAPGPSGLRAAVRSHASPRASAVQCQLVPYNHQDLPQGYYEDTRAQDTLFLDVGNGWYRYVDVKYFYLSASRQYRTVEGFYWDPVAKRCFAYENGLYRAQDGSGYYLYNGTHYAPSQQPQVPQHQPMLGQTSTVTSGVTIHHVSNMPLHTVSSDKEEEEEEETVVMSQAALAAHLPSGEATEVDGVELHMVLGRIKAAYRSGNFQGVRPTDFEDWRGVLPKKPKGYYKEFAEKKQSHWRVVVGWDPSNPDSMELYFNSGRSGFHYGDADWWRYDPNRQKWARYP